MRVLFTFGDEIILTRTRIGRTHLVYFISNQCGTSA